MSFNSGESQKSERNTRTRAESEGTRCEGSFEFTRSPRIARTASLARAREFTLLISETTRILTISRSQRLCGNHTLSRIAIHCQSNLLLNSMFFATIDWEATALACAWDYGHFMPTSIKVVSVMEQNDLMYVNEMTGYHRIVPVHAPLCDFRSERTPLKNTAGAIR